MPEITSKTTKERILCHNFDLNYPAHEAHSGPPIANEYVAKIVEHVVWFPIYRKRSSVYQHFCSD